MNSESVTSRISVTCYAEAIAISRSFLFAAISGVKENTERFFEKSTHHELFNDTLFELDGESAARPDWFAPQQYECLKRLHAIYKSLGHTSGELLEDLTSKRCRFSGKLEGLEVASSPDSVATSVSQLTSTNEATDQVYHTVLDYIENVQVLGKGRMKESKSARSYNLMRATSEGRKRGLSENHSRYMVAKQLRSLFSMHLSHSFVSAFQIAVDVINDSANTERQFTQNEPVEVFTRKADGRQKIQSFALLGDYLAHAGKFDVDELPERSLSALVGALSLASLTNELSVNGDFVQLRGQSLDAEYLLSVAFGHSTDIVGFDDLFGGGGLLFADDISSGAGVKDSLPGRIVLVRGGNGCGKTLLCLSLAADIARKGGLCIFNALEYNSEVARFALARAGFPSKDKRYRFVNRNDLFLRLMKREPTECGTLFLRGVDPKSKEPVEYSKLLKQLATDVLPGLTNGSPIVVFIDSLNALTRESTNPRGSRADNDERLRRSMLSLLHGLTNAGANVVLTAEEDESWSGFGEDIADTVIRLSSDDLSSGRAVNLVQRSHRARYITVRKSRLQREQRGVHPFRIRPGRGIEVYPSTASFAAIDRSRGPARTQPGLFGVSDIDASFVWNKSDVDKQSATTPRSLADDKHDCGSVTLLQGKLGTYKTQLALSFVSWYSNEDYRSRSDKHRTKSSEGERTFGSLVDRVGLVISVRYSDLDIRSKLNQPICRDTIKAMRRSAEITDSIPPKQIWTCKLDPGYVYPGEIFKQIESYFERARMEKVKIDRVFLDNPGEWEDACPFVKEDEIFGDTLVAFLRRREVKIVASNRMVAEGDSNVIRAVSESVDTWINLKHHDESSTKDYSMSLQIERSPGMEHSRAELGVVYTSAEGLSLEGLVAGDS